MQSKPGIRLTTALCTFNQRVTRTAPPPPITVPPPSCSHRYPAPYISSSRRWTWLAVKILVIASPGILFSPSPRERVVGCGLCASRLCHQIWMETSARPCSSDGVSHGVLHARDATHLHGPPGECQDDVGRARDEDIPLCWPASAAPNPTSLIAERDRFRGLRGDAVAKCPIAAEKSLVAGCARAQRRASRGAAPACVTSL